MNRKEYKKQWYKENRERTLEQRKTHYQKNRERILEQRKKFHQENKKRLNKERTQRHQENKEARNEKDKRRRTNDIQFRLTCLLRKRLHHAIKGNYKSGSAVRDLGCSIEFLKEYLESLFQPGMTWDNHGIKGWHIDHIKPLASFDLTDRKQLLEAVNYTNLQPLWWQDNLKKG